MILEKLKEHNIVFNVKQIIVDFELNIHKSIDEIFPDVEILGCFFHLSKALQSKVEKNGMKVVYEKNFEFQRFVKKCVALSSLPLEDLETGMKWLKENVFFMIHKLKLSSIIS